MPLPGFPSPGGLPLQMHPAPFLKCPHRHRRSVPAHLPLPGAPGQSPSLAGYHGTPVLTAVSTAPSVPLPGCRHLYFPQSPAAGPGKAQEGYSSIPLPLTGILPGALPFWFSPGRYRFPGANLNTAPRQIHCLCPAPLAAQNKPPGFHTWPGVPPLSRHIFWPSLKAPW